MYRKLLVPLDGSSLAESALVPAKTLALGCSITQIVLLTVVEPFRAQPYRKGDDYVEKIQKEAVLFARTYLKGLIEKLKAEGFNAESEVIEGDPPQVILDYSKKNGVDLIILSTHGNSGISRLVFGSVADRIVHHSTIPVMVIPVNR